MMKLKTRQEIAQAYGINRRTLSRKLKAAGIKLKKGLVNEEGLKKIQSVLGKVKGGGGFFTE